MFAILNDEFDVKLKCGCRKPSCKKRMELIFSTKHNQVEILISNSNGQYPSDCGIRINREELIKRLTERK